MRAFNHVAGLRPGKSVFNLSYEKKFDCDMGQLIPIMCDEVVPGDVFMINHEVVIRFKPLVAPVLHEINVYVHYFFVPYRLLWDDWEEFISGGVDGEFAATPPAWEPEENEKLSLWDYFGFPPGVDPEGAYPLDFPRRAYNFVYNEYYRDETLIEEVDLENEEILNSAWEKDYFTSALPNQQRGLAPALPVEITGNSSAVWSDDVFAGNPGTFWDGSSWRPLRLNGNVGGAMPWNTPSLSVGLSDLNFRFPVDLTRLNANTVDGSDFEAATFDIAQLRLAFQIQKWMERNNRAGVRYTEFLRAHFGVSPRDERLDRPEYIGGSKSPVIVSEVLQTSSSDSTSAQGNMAGHGISVDRQHICNYRVQEFGLILGIMKIMPRTAYQQGINRQWLRRTRFDFYFPEFANLSEQAIENAELFATDVETWNRDMFGYQGRYDEMRVKQSQICGNLRDIYEYWHLGRVFDPASPPALNGDFVTVQPETLKRIFAVQDEPGLIVNFANLIKAVRPLPVVSNPGLIDHM